MSAFKTAGNPIKQGWLTKLGAQVKNWKRRWFVLTDNALLYFKKPTGDKAQGEIILKKGFKVRAEQHKKSPFMLSLATDGRVYMMFAESEAEMQEWVKVIGDVLQKFEVSSSPRPATPPPSVVAAPTAAPVQKVASTPAPLVVDSATYNLFVSTQYNTDEIGDDLLLCIFSFADLATLSNLVKVSKRFQTLANKAYGPFTLYAQRRQRIEESPTKTLSARSRYTECKSTVSWMKSNPNVSEFWNTFIRAIPSCLASPQKTTHVGDLSFNVSTSVELHKMTWRAEGPQHLFITPLVDFFVNVGAPETEIDKLNDFGSAINPPRIGFWIDVSKKEGLDGGWYFPFATIPLNNALQAVEPGKCVTDLREWAVKHFKGNPPICYYVGRDMGAEPPRQTEIRMALPASLSLKAQINALLEAHKLFGFPTPPEDIIALIRKYNTSPNTTLALSINIASDDNFVKIAIVHPNPGGECLLKLQEYLKVSKKKVAKVGKLEAACLGQGSSFRSIEYQYLKPGYGYKVYDEGFSAIVTYDIGKEECWS